MAYLGYLCLGEEIINDCRTLQFIADGRGPQGIQCRNCDPCCPDISAGLGYPNGYNITDAPWYDPLDPDSVDFAGILVTNIEGLEPGAFTRPITEASGYGAVIGAGRLAAPNIVVTGLLMAATCCGQDFGFRWLRSALKGSCKSGQSNCAGDDLTFLSCEPQTPDLDCLTPEEAENFDYEAWLKPYYRSFKGAALIDGPKISNKIARACPECYDCCIYEVQFTIGAAKPCVYRDPITLAHSTFTCVTDTECVEWITDPDCTDCGADLSDCGTDPDCKSTIAPPTVPQATNPCAEDCIVETTCSVCVDIPAGTFPSTGEGTVIITIDNQLGIEPIRKIKVQIWENPLMRPADELEECDICSELNVGYLAAGSKLVIDGANGTSTIFCPGGKAVRANPFISSTSGSPNFQYPAMEGCLGNFTVCVSAPGMIDQRPTVTIEAVGREC